MVLADLSESVMNPPRTASTKATSKGQRYPLCPLRTLNVGCSSRSRPPANFVSCRASFGLPDDGEFERRRATASAIIGRNRVEVRLTPKDTRVHTRSRSIGSGRRPTSPTRPTTETTFTRQGHGSASYAPATCSETRPMIPEEAFVASLSSCHMLTFLADRHGKRARSWTATMTRRSASWRKMRRGNWP